MAELNLKHFLFQVVVWLVVAVGVLSFEDPFNLPRRCWARYFDSLPWLRRFKLFVFRPGQRFIAIGVTLSSRAFYSVDRKFYWFDIELKALHSSASFPSFGRERVDHWLAENQKITCGEPPREDHLDAAATARPSSGQD